MEIIKLLLEHPFATCFILLFAGIAIGIAMPSITINKTSKKNDNIKNKNE
jgi:hypothetical protein